MLLRSKLKIPNVPIPRDFSLQKKKKKIVVNRSSNNSFASRYVGRRRVFRKLNCVIKTVMISAGGESRESARGGSNVCKWFDRVCYGGEEGEEKRSVPQSESNGTRQSIKRNAKHPSRPFSL